MRFICLDGRQGEKIWVNPANIAMVEEDVAHNDCTIITFSGEENYLRVRGTLKETITTLELAE